MAKKRNEIAKLESSDAKNEIHTQDSFHALVPNRAMIEALKQRYDIFRQLQKEVLEENVDYGFPAGRKNDQQKPSLYKSGAEKLTQLFNLIADFQELEAIETEIEVRYKFRCELRTIDGRLVGVGYGLASSYEKEHWRKNPLGNANTILKIAKKRSHVDAVLTGLGASNVFTQDLEDYEPEQFSTAEPMSDRQRELIAIMIGRFASAYKISPNDAEKRLVMLLGKSIQELSREEASIVIDFLRIRKRSDYQAVYQYLAKKCDEIGFWQLARLVSFEEVADGKLNLDDIKRLLEPQIDPDELI